MGCDIHSFAEVRQSDGSWQQAGDVFPLDDFDREWQKKTHGSEPFSWRNYGLFGFLAGVRNYSAVTPLSPPRGLPADLSAPVLAAADEWQADAHSHSWLALRELADFDYDSVMRDRRITRQTGPNSFDGGSTATMEEEHLTRQETYREFLGDHFFRDLAVLQSLGPADDVRVVFWFDN